MSNFIPDGYSTTGYIAGDPPHRDPVKFTYRPAVSQEKAAVTKAIMATADPLKEEALAAAFVAQHVSDWDIKKPDGSDVAVTADNALRLHPALASRLFNIVLGMGSPDVDPDAPSDAAQLAGEEIAAAKNGMTAGDALAKN